MTDADDQRIAEYWPKLVRLAERNLSPRLKRKFAAEDIAQTVFRTAARRIADGQFRLDHFETDDDIWRVLVVITLRRISNKARSFQTQKQSWDREIAIGDEFGSLLATEPSSEDAVALMEILELFEEKLADAYPEEARRYELNEILTMRMNGSTFEEIADSMNCSIKTVQCRMEIIRDLFRELDIS